MGSLSEVAAAVCLLLREEVGKQKVGQSLRSNRRIFELDSCSISTWENTRGVGTAPGGEDA